ncbi:MAG: fructose-bisphosphate aldolase [Actinobacteria bacterium]|nr:fructose-bisphosphate aldolase [Actinomycetota bacterium]
MNTNKRPHITELNLSTGKKARLHRILHESGLRNGTAMLLPYGLGFGPGFQGVPEGLAPDSPTDAIRFAFEGQFSAMVLPVDLAEKFYWDYAGELPLILTLNGMTAGPVRSSQPAPQGTVADAVRLGADAVGYFLYTDSPVRDGAFADYQLVREDAERFGMPLFVWAYPRGRFVEEMGGTDSLYAIDYATRVSHRLGADVVVVHFPHPENLGRRTSDNVPRIFPQEAINTVVRTADQSLVIVSSGRDISDEAMVTETQQAMAAGAAGIVFDRALPDREHRAWIPLIRDLKHALGVYCS